jgi:lipid A disaccharide synthetase
VIRALSELGIGVTVEGVGGPNMEAAGAKLLEPMERLSVMGLSEVARTIPRHALLLRRIRKLFSERSYDLAILIDYPGFNLRVAAAATRTDIPVLLPSCCPLKSSSSGAMAFQPSSSGIRCWIESLFPIGMRRVQR